MERFMDSLLRGYPFQTFLLWETTQGVKSRRFMSILEKDPELSRYYDEVRSGDGEDKTLVLDGQQRLQTLHAVFRGGIRGDKAHQIKRAYLNLKGAPGESGDDDIAYEVEFLDEREAGTGDWFCIPDLYRKYRHLTKEQLLKATEDALMEKGWDREDISRALDRVGRLHDVLFGDDQIWVARLADRPDRPFSYREIGTIFVRVNQGGTRLSAADLYFALLREEWDEVEQLFEGALSVLDSRNEFEFDTKFCLNCLLALTGRPQSSDPGELAKNPDIIGQMKELWPKAELGFRKLRDLLSNNCMIHHPSLIRSYSSLIPLFCYLADRDPAGNDGEDMKAYFYKAQLLKWFSSSTNAKIDRLAGLVRGKTTFPLQDIKAYFSGDHKLPTDLVPGDLSAMHRRINRVTYLHICYATQHNWSAHDVASERNLPHVDHIYPKTPLRGLGLDPSEIDHIGNYRFVEAAENWRKNAALPAVYFARLADEVRKRHLLVDQYVKDPSKLHFDIATFKDFRDKRRDAIWKIVNSVVNR